MAKRSNSSASKPRRKKTSINFKTPREKNHSKLKRNSSNQADLVTNVAPSKHSNDDYKSLGSTRNTAKGKRTVSTPSKTRKSDGKSENLPLLSSEEKKKRSTVAHTTLVNSDKFQSPSTPPSTDDNVMLLMVYFCANCFVLCRLQLCVV